MDSLFGLVLIWGIPALLLWSVVLSMIRAIRDPEPRGFFLRILAFFAHIYEYTVNSFMAWFGLMIIMFGIVGLIEGYFWIPIMLLLFGPFMVYGFFPRYRMPDE